MIGLPGPASPGSVVHQHTAGSGGNWKYVVRHF